jgi:hypothetical protein
MMCASYIARMNMFTFIHDQTLQSLTWTKNYMQQIWEGGCIIHYRESVDAEDSIFWMHASLQLFVELEN